MTDLPPFITNSPHRNIPWTGHGKFPRASVAHHIKLGERWGKDYAGELRVFKRFGEEYRLLAAEEVDRYMKDPDYV